MTRGLDYLGSPRFQGLALLGVVFVVGVLAGVAGDRLIGERDHRRGPPPPGPPHRHGLPPMIERLDPTPAQRAIIDSLLEAFRPRTDAIVRETMPRLRAVGDSLEAAVRLVLTPAQRVQFDRDAKERRARRGPPGPGPRGWMPPPGPFGPPPGPPPEDGPPPGPPPDGPP